MIASPARAAAFTTKAVSLVLTAPGFAVGIVGITDGIGPTGLPGLLELAGFVFCGWAVCVAIEALLRRFLHTPKETFGHLAAALVLSGGFYFLLNVLGLEASLAHKRLFSMAMTLLGGFALLLFGYRVMQRMAL